MNIRGIVIDKIKAKLINEERDNLTKSALKSLDIFNSFDWSNFKKQEFISIVSALDNILNKTSLPNHQSFVIFYETDVTEMDVVTVLEKDKRPIFVNFEMKNGDETILQSSLLNQIKKRQENAMPQLFKDANYLIIGVINNVIYKSCYYNSDETIWYEGDSVLDVLNTMNSYNNVNEFLYQVNNMDSIVNVFNKIERNEFKYYDDIKYTTESFVSRLNSRSDENGIICYGNAGCGKTVMALKMFNELPNAKLLILNPKLFFSLNMEPYFYEKKASYKPEEIEDILESNDILIVDEAQRLNETQIIKLVNLGNKIIFFGDEKQSFGRNGNLYTSKELKKFIMNKTGCKFYVRNLKKSKRYSDEVSTIIDNLTSLKPHKTKKANDYEINIFCANEEQFIKKYEQTTGLKKIYIPFTISYNSGFIINNSYYSMADFRENGFSIYENIDPNKMGHTLHALSFDVDHGFVYLPTVKIVKSNRQNKIYYRDVTDNDDVTKFMNELNILFSRGRKSLNIFVNDIHTYLFLKARLPK